MTIYKREGRTPHRVFGREPVGRQAIQARWQMRGPHLSSFLSENRTAILLGVAIVGLWAGVPWAVEAWL